MMGAARKVTDPVEAAEQRIGRSRRLIAATLDDLSAHHSWLETYHRDERLRAERLRRRNLRERLERRYRRIVDRTKYTARTSYVTTRYLVRLSKRLVGAAARWTSPRLQRLWGHMARTAAQAWSATRLHTPRIARQTSSAACVTGTALRDGFRWSVRASEETGHIFRRRLSIASAAAMAELRCRTAPSRRRGLSEWTRARLRVQRLGQLIEQRAAAAIDNSQALARVQKSVHRGTIRGRRRVARHAAVVRHHAIRIEASLSARILRIVPKFRGLLQAHMPATMTPTNAVSISAGRALILRPTTALVCLAPQGNRLPVPFRA